MGCRTRVFGDRHGENTSIGRGNLSFTTINLPKLAVEAAIEAGVLEKWDGWYQKTTLDNERIQNEGYISIFHPNYNEYRHYMTVRDKEKRKENAIKYFWEKLEKYLVLSAKQLEERYEFQSTAKVRQFPLLMSGLWMGSEKLNPNDTVESVLKHGTLGVGFIGLAETLTALTGKHHGESKEAQELGLKIVSYIDKRCKDFSEIYDKNFSCFATPAEGLSGKFTKRDRKEFGFIRGVLDKEYYTNSNHVPVEYGCSYKHKIEVEAPYHPITPAGHIAYVEVKGDVVDNPEAIEDIVNIMYNNQVGYCSINHNQVRCDRCNYESADPDKFPNMTCPHCGSKEVTHLQRITGYLTTDVRKWNAGKRAEFEKRVTHGRDDS